MSLFGPVDDNDKRRWQHQGLTGLTRLIEVGRERELPPVVWELRTGSRLVGRVEPFDHPPRDVYDQWHSALSDLCGPAKEWPERATASGQIRLSAQFTLPLGDAKYPSCSVVLIAEWFADDLVQAVEK